MPFSGNNMMFCMETDLRPEQKPRGSPCRGWASRRTSGTSGPRCASLGGSWSCRSWGRAERRAVAWSRWDQSPWPAQTPVGRTAPSQDRPTLQQHDKLVCDPTKLNSLSVSKFWISIFQNYIFVNADCSSLNDSFMSKRLTPSGKILHDCDWNNIT